MKTYSMKPSDVSRKWYVVDAAEIPLGRLATQVASLLLGKGKPTVTPHMDGGDYVIVINSANLVVTGNKQKDKKYHRHSGFPGGLYTRSLNEQLERDPNKIIFDAVRGMLPVNKLRDGRLARLKIYKDDQHNHAPQKPQTLSLKKGNKNA
jgi:large subunit ribosomal protein L13